ncbi:protein translocase subunit SecF [Corynebacterium sp. H130]|uniref:protein translocase subunit SecF n=1 Tax=Corynebacterium sp. H130 TaxID=3133444 RepID=UPI0030B3A7BF
MSASTFSRLYTGEGGIDFVGRSKLWYRITAGVLAASILLIIFRGFSLGIDFEGGTKMNMPDADYSIEKVEDVFTSATGVTPELVQVVGAGDSRMVEINAERLSDEQIDAARVALFNEFQPKDQTGEASPDAVGDSTVSESWGSTITNRMLLSMLAFLGLTFIYIAIRFERDMSIAAITALLVDIVVISGIYSLVGFEVTPATVIGLLTVLSFSLYDTVVVFDKVRENTAGFEASRRRTYAEQANLAVNQTVMRSISTTIISALPIIALMVVAVWMMGVGTLKDLALVQLIGVIEGALSSVFLATPILVSLKRRNKKIQEHEQLVRDYRAGKLDDGPEASSEAEAKPVRRTVAPITAEAQEEFLDTRGDGKSWRPGQ